MNTAVIAVPTELSPKVALQTPSVFDLTSRIGRVRFIAYTFAIAFIQFSMMYAPVHHDLIILTNIVGGLLGAVCVYRRLGDLDWSGWITLLSFVPIVNSFVLLLLATTPGEPGVTQRGNPPSPNHPLEVAGAICLPPVCMYMVTLIVMSVRHFGM